MKAGTTTLFEHLRSHPQVCASLKKEPNFFLDENVHSLENYNSLFDFNPSIHRVKMEASTAYSKYPRHKNIAENISKLNLNPKFIYVVRNPIDRINSEINFWKNYPQWSDPKSEFNFNQMIDRSNYFLQLSKFEKVFDANQILVLDFLELKTNPQHVVEKVCQFLEIKHHLIKKQNKVANKTEKKSDLELNLIKKVPKLLKILPVSWKHNLKLLIRKNSKVSNFELTASEEKQAREKLRPDMVKFNAQYNFDTSIWGF